MTVITVLGQAGSPLSFKADTFDIDENGYRTLLAGGTVVAKFSPATWGGVYDQDAVNG